MTCLLSVLQTLDPEKVFLVTRDKLIMFSKLSKDYCQLVSTKLPQDLLAEKIKICNPDYRVYPKIKQHLVGVLSYSMSLYGGDRVALECVEKMIFFATSPTTPLLIQNEIDCTSQIVVPVNSILNKYRHHPDVVGSCLQFLSFMMTATFNSYGDSNSFGRTFHEMIELYINQRDSLCKIMRALSPTHNKIGQGFKITHVKRGEFTGEFSLLIIKVLQKYAFDLDICVPVMDVLNRLSENPDLNMVMINSQLVEAATQAVQTHTNSEHIAETFCGILCNICLGATRKEGFQKIRALDSLRIMRDILQRFGEHENVTQAAEMALCYCAPN